jgi:hypothetical protein
MDLTSLFEMKFESYSGKILREPSQGYTEVRQAIIPEAWTAREIRFG